MSGVWDTITGKSGRRAEQSSIRASELEAAGQGQALDYMKEVEALPLEMRNRFLPQYADIISGGQGQQDLIDSAMESPLYRAIMGGQQVGEESILRNASATGGLRSGNAVGDLTDYGSQLQNRALLESYNQNLQGIQGLANIGLNTNAIAGATAAPSATRAQGIVAGAQARQQSDQAITNNLMGLGGMALGGYFSDIRLKDNIKQIGRQNGVNIYSWDWNEEAETFGLIGEGKGCMAHEVAQTRPDLIIEKDGFIMVNYEKLGLKRAA